MRARTFRTAASASANSYGHYATPPGVSTWFSGAVARCMKADDTFPRVTVHDLRHTPASLAISAGANVKVVQRMLGHASAAMTLDTYADLFTDDLDAVATLTTRSVPKMCPRTGYSGRFRVTNTHLTCAYGFPDSVPSVRFELFSVVLVSGLNAL